MGNEVTVRYPWEPMPAEPIGDTVVKLQADLRYMVTHTAILTHSEHAALQMCVNTPRGQIIPRNVCKFKGGTTIEFQDIGMPQVGAPEMTVKDLIAQAWNVAQRLGLELET